MRLLFYAVAGHVMDKSLLFASKDTIYFSINVKNSREKFTKHVLRTKIGLPTRFAK